MKLFVLFFAFVYLLSCKDGSGSGREDYKLLKDQLNGLQSRMDSLINAMEKLEPSKAITQSKGKKKKKTTNSSTDVTSSPSSNSTTDYTWKISESKTAPSYRPTKQKETYQIRVGAVCCDGSRSYATGRGACSHHGGVCEWLYQ